MDIVYLKDLRVDAVIGIYDWERQIRQQVRVDLEMAWDNRPAATSDDIKDTLNYKAAAKKVKKVVQETQFQLVETLAETIAEVLTRELQIPWIRVRVGKPSAVTDSREVGVIIERGNRDDRVILQQAVIACIDIGSNINRRENIQSCVNQLAALFPDIRFSQTVESAAEGFDGDPFYNLSARFTTFMSVEQLSALLKSIEDQHARVRNTEKFISRTLDIDILLFGETVLQPGRDIPRKEILKFAFVLYPLAEIAGELVHPVEKKTIAEVAAASMLDKKSLSIVPDFPTIPVN